MHAPKASAQQAWQESDIKPSAIGQSMNKVLTLSLTAATLLLAASQMACAVESDVALAPAIKHLENQAPRRILFVGNSYLYYNPTTAFTTT